MTKKKYHKKYIKPSQEKVIKKRISDLNDQVTPFFGRYTSEQKEWVNTWSTELSPFEALSLKQQVEWSKKLEVAFSVRHDKVALAKNMDRVLFFHTDDWAPKDEAIMDVNQDITYTLVAQLVRSQTAKQRAKMNKKLKSYQEDFITLSQKK